MRKLMLLLLVGILAMLAGCGGSNGSTVPGMDSGTSIADSIFEQAADAEEALSVSSGQEVPILEGSLELGAELAATQHDTELIWGAFSLILCVGSENDTDVASREIASLAVRSACIPGSTADAVVGEPFAVELIKALPDPQMMELRVSGLADDPNDVRYDLYRFRQTSAGVEIGYGWAQVKDGVLRDQFAYEQGAVYAVVDQDLLDAQRSVSSYGPNVPLLTTQDPDNWVAGSDEESRKLNIIFVHGLDPGKPFWLQDGDEWRYFKEHFTKHWEEYAPAEEQDPAAIGKFCTAWKSDTTCWAYYYNTVRVKMEALAEDLAWRIKDQIIDVAAEDGTDAEVVLVGYSKGAMVSLAAHDYLERNYASMGLPDQVVDAMVTLNGATLGSEWVNVASEIKGLEFGILPKRIGIKDLASIYNVEFDNPLAEATQTDYRTKHYNKQLRRRIERVLPSLQDREWFYPISSYVPGGFNSTLNEIFSHSDFVFNIITDIEVSDKNWVPVEDTELRMQYLGESIVKYDGILAYYSQQAEGATLEFESGDPPAKLNHGLDHTDVWKDGSADALTWMQDYLAEIALRIFGNSDPVAELESLPDPAKGYAPLAVTFDATDSYDPEGCPLDFEWDFDEDGLFGESGTDEETFDGINVAQVTYSTPGEFIAYVRVTDRFGATDIAWVDVVVEELNLGDIVVVYPNSSTTWSAQQEKITMQWVKEPGQGSTVHVDIYKGGSYLRLLHKETLNDGVCNKGGYPITDLAPGDDYQVKVVSKAGKFGYSEFFTITE